MSHILHGRYKINCARYPISGPLICKVSVASAARPFLIVTEGI
jgi:hypothetical protein|eukprot:SAG25_NODE_2_length_31535_cov_18.197322_13_plen_43_part_00